MSMNIYNIETQENLQQYLHGQLKSTDLSAFEKVLENDEELKSYANFDQQLLLAMRKEEWTTVKQLVLGVAATNDVQPDFENLEEWNHIKEQAIRKQTGGTSYGQYWMGGLTFCALLWFGLTQFILPAQQLNQIVTTYLAPYENIVHVGKESETQLRDGMAAYDQANYEQSALFLSQSVHKKNNKAILLYLGISYLFEDETTKAIDVFEVLSLSEGTPYVNTSKWYLALAHLKNNEKEKALQLLQEIKDDPLRIDDIRQLMQELE